MSKTSKFVAIVAVILVGAAGTAIFFTNRPNDTAETSNTADRGSALTDLQDEALTDQPDSDTEHTATITLTEDGFSIDQSTVQAGDTVLVVNRSDRTLDFSSDPHPTHTDQPELNVGTIAPGESRTFTITQPGTWGFHDHNNSTFSGSITVE